MNKYLNNLTIPQKFAICGMGFMLPLVVLLIFACAGYNHSIRNSRLEIYGIRVIEPAGRILDLLPQHQYLAGAFFKGDTTAQIRLKRTAGEIDQAFSDLLNQTGKLSSSLRIDTNSLKTAEQPQQISEAIGQLAVAADQTKESLNEFRTAIDNANTAVQELQTEVSRFKISL